VGSQGVSACTTPCAAGTYSRAAGGICLPCDLGRFQPGRAALRCKPCAPGRFTAITSSFSCAQCPEGQLAVADNAACSFHCPPGQDHNDTGTAVGHAHDSRLAGVNRQCEFCIPGERRAAAEFSCGWCPADTFSSERRDACVSACAKGSQLARGASGAAVACEECPVGTFADGLGAEGAAGGAWSPQMRCMRCPTGKFVALPGAEACKFCPGGRKSIATGDSCVYNCRPGAYGAGASCLPCPPGRFQTQLQYLRCSHCPAGAFGVGMLAARLIACGDSECAVGAGRS
jgi:hypothetical protein